MNTERLFHVKKNQPQNLIRKAIFPVAGYGTRFLPLTKAIPKEMLPIVDTPLIQFAVQEAYEAGIREMIFVTARNKHVIEDYFDYYYELDHELSLANKTHYQSMIDAITPKDMTCVFIHQPRAMGLGHAILCAQALINQEPFAVLLVDDLIFHQTPVLGEMIALFNQYRTNILAVKQVEKELLPLYGVIEPQKRTVRSDLFDVTAVKEKPKRQDAPSQLAIVGRYIFTPKLFHYLKMQEQGVNGEIQLTDAVEKLCQDKSVLAYQFPGVHFDCGSKLGFAQANYYLTQMHPEIGEAFMEWVRTFEFDSPSI